MSKRNVVVITRKQGCLSEVNVNGKDVHNATAKVDANGKVTLEFYTSQLIVEDDKPEVETLP